MKNQDITHEQRIHSFSWLEMGLCFILKQSRLGEDSVFEQPELGYLVEKVVKVLFEACEFWVD